MGMERKLTNHNQNANSFTELNHYNHYHYHHSHYHSSALTLCIVAGTFNSPLYISRLSISLNSKIESFLSIGDFFFLLSFLARLIRVLCVCARRREGMRGGINSMDGIRWVQRMYPLPRIRIRNQILESNCSASLRLARRILVIYTFRNDNHTYASTLLCTNNNNHWSDNLDYLPAVTTIRKWIVTHLTQIRSYFVQAYHLAIRIISFKLS